MSIVYNPTRDPYDSYTWPSWIVMPSDGDPFTAQSAYNFEKPLLDRSVLVFEAALKRGFRSLPIKAWSNQTTQIQIGSYSSLETVLSNNYKISSKGDITTLTNADLEPAGSFVPSTRYYVYLKHNVDNTTKLVIKTDPPHISLLYRDNAGAQDKQYKYILSFKVDSFGGILQFRKNGKITLFQNAIRVLGAGQALTYTLIPLTDFIPPYVKHLIFNATFFNGSTTISNAATINNGFASLNVLAPPNTIANSTIYTQQFTLPIDSALGGLRYIIDISTTPPSSLTIDLVGYYD